jgi:hypothetical protein
MIIFLATVTEAISLTHSVIDPIIYSLSAVGGLLCVALLIVSGFHYTTSSGNPEKLDRAKRIIRNSLIGLIIIISAASVTGILSHAYGSQQGISGQHLPSLESVKPDSASLGLVGVLIKAITGVLQSIVDTVGRPFIDALSYFTNSTPLMADNNSVFNVWLITTGIADALFVLVVVLIGFNVMSSSALGFDELDVRHIIPQLAACFVLINSSIFIIDVIIQLSNGLIVALKAGVGEANVWGVLSKVTEQAGATGLATLLIMIVFLVLVFMLLVYYVGRIVTLYLGAVLSPILLLLWLLPSFRDFASNAARTYLATIFVLFIHVVILSLAASIFSILEGTGNNNPDVIMTLIVGMSTLITLIKTQGVLTQLNYASIGPKSLRNLSRQFVNSFNSVNYSYGEDS